jgi:heparan-alpha-glucosaminide N-acetyltransferase
MAQPLLPTSETDGLVSVNTVPTNHAKPKRLASLDIVRGVTISWMILADELGGAYPRLNHSPWNHITFADFVMPWFLFMVGTSLSLSLRRYKQPGGVRSGVKAVLLRGFKLYLLGELLQGGGWFGGGTYGYNLATLRWCGILQRIGFAYAVGGLMELLVPEITRKEGLVPRSAHVSVFTTHGWKWLAAVGFIVLHLILTFGTFVPSWTSYWGHDKHGNSVLLETPVTIECDVRGHVATPECSATSYYDRALFGQDHLGAWMSERLPQCSSCSPGAPTHNPHKADSPGDYRPTCVWKVDAPAWCFAHMYDPEGALATVPGVATVWLGAHFGRASAALRGHGSAMPLLAHWAACTALLIAGGLALDQAWAMNKQLWSTSYTLFMAGTCGGALAAAYLAVDAFAGGASPRLAKATAWARWALTPLETFGMNAILFFFFHGTAENIVDAFYVSPPKRGGGTHIQRDNGSLLTSPDGFVHETVFGGISDLQARQLAFVLLKLGFYLLAGWILYRRKIFWKV